MLETKTQSQKNNLYLFLILIIGCLLRFYRLGYQSLWLDELYTMIECDPDLSWMQTTSQVLSTEHKSPFYFYIVKLFLTVFGNTEVVARSVSVIGGVFGVYAIYLLGKELSNNRTGLLAATIMAVNPYHIYYSQEARGYIFLVLFTILSFVYFVRTLREKNTKNAILYGVATLLGLHIHPFGALVPVSQFLILVVCFFTLTFGTNERSTLLKWFGLSYLLIVLGFLPLLGGLKNDSAISEFWIAKPTEDFYATFFYDFFGGSGLLKPMLLLLLISYLVSVVRTKGKDENFEGPSFNFVLVAIALVTIFLIPFLYSILKVPVTINRFLISAFPILVLMVAMGLEALENKLVRVTVFLIFVIITFIHIVFVQEFNQLPVKTQFREMTEYVKQNSDQPYPINNQKTAANNSYYIRKFGITGLVSGIDNKKFIDSLLLEEQDQAFWLIGAHQDPKPVSEVIRRLETRYVLAKSKDFLDAWAQLYKPVNDGKKVFIKLDFTDFDKSAVGNVNGDSVLTLWGNDPKLSRPVTLPPGKYRVKLNSSGTPYKNIYPQISIYKNEMLLGTYFTTAIYGFSPPFVLEVLPGEKPFILRVKMDNDENNALTNEDRNGFVKSVYFFRN